MKMFCLNILQATKKSSSSILLNLMPAGESFEKLLSVPTSFQSKRQENRHQDYKFSPQLAFMVITHDQETKD